MWTKIKGNLVNLDNVAEIYPVYNEDTSLGIDYVGIGCNGFFVFDSTEERDQEFDRLERLLLNDRSW